MRENAFGMFVNGRKTRTITLKLIMSVGAVIIIYRIIILKSPINGGKGDFHCLMNFSVFNLGK